MSDRCEMTDLPAEQCACEHCRPDLTTYGQDDVRVMSRFVARYQGWCPSCETAIQDGERIARLSTDDYVQREVRAVNTMAAPWPIVNECYYPAPWLVEQGHTCPQCDGSHDHAWVAWREPEPAPYGGVLPVRCRVCGGRKCDRPACLLRRHHYGDHEEY